MVGPKVVTAAEGGKLWQLFHIILPFFKDNIRHFARTNNTKEEGQRAVRQTRQIAECQHFHMASSPLPPPRFPLL
jgi:hypothetical protein